MKFNSRCNCLTASAVDVRWAFRCFNRRRRKNESSGPFAPPGISLGVARFFFFLRAALIFLRLFGGAAWASTFPGTSGDGRFLAPSFSFFPPHSGKWGAGCVSWLSHIKFESRLSAEGTHQRRADRFPNLVRSCEYRAPPPRRTSCRSRRNLDALSPTFSQYAAPW